jgi:glycosyltransferase involved in cell wall biosynthesis
MTSIRLLYFHQYFNTPEMGGSTRSYETSTRLAKMGFDVTIITTLRDKKISDNLLVEKINGVTIYWLNIPYSNKMNFVRRIIAFLQFAFKSLRVGSKINADVIFASSTPLTVAFPALYCNWKNRIPLVFEVRDLWPNIPIAMGVIKSPLIKWLAESLEMITYKNSSKIVALSPDMKSYIVNLGISEDKIIVVPNAADFDLFQNIDLFGPSFRNEKGIKDDTILVLYAGTFGNVNGCEYIVRLAAVLNDCNVCFVMLGDGKERDQLLELAHNAGVLNKNIFFYPQISKKQIPEVFHSADLVISTIINVQALEANSANKVFDGLAAGRGVIINHGGWISDFLKQSNAGIQLSWDISAAANELRGLIVNKQRILEMGINAKNLAKEKFNRDTLTNEIAEVIKSVCKAN